MEHASPAMFRPTWQQALGQGLHLGALVGAGVLLITLLLIAVDAVAISAADATALVLGPAAGGLLAGAVAGRRAATQISAGGIRTRSVFSDGVAAWSEVVDLRAERRGGRTVVSVYLDSGASVQLRAPYSGEFFDSDPGFEGKMFALSYLCRSHRFGGLPG